MASGATSEQRPEESKGVTRPRLDLVAEAIFEFLSGSSFFIWGALIYFSRDLNISLKRDDIVELAQTTSALAGIALAALAILQDREKFLKLFLAVITTIFILATTVAWLTVMFVGQTQSEWQSIQLRCSGWIGILFFSYGFSRMAGFKWRQWGIEFAYPFSRAAAFLLPVFLVGVWPSDKSSFGPSVALSMGGMIYLLAATVFLIVAVHRERPV